MKLPADAVSAEIASLDTEDIYSVSLRAYVDSDDGAKDSDAEPVYGQAAVPVIVSTCGQDAACPMAGFSDLSADAWYRDGVHWALDREIMNGRTQSRLAPGDNVTRAEVAAMLLRTTAIIDG